jgi:ClpP class serine protease
MGDVAASGGYYIATPADRIFAEATTITGSIGVFGMIPYTGKMLENKLGITFDRVQTHNHSVMSTNRKLTPEELAMVQNEVNGIYSQFMDRVAKGRSLPVARVNQIARGRVWTGKDALSIGLVDELGSLTDVIDFAKREIKDKEAKVIYYPKVKEDKFGSIIKMIKQENEDVLQPVLLLLEKAEQILSILNLSDNTIVKYNQLKKLTFEKLSLGFKPLTKHGNSNIKNQNIALDNFWNLIFNCSLAYIIINILRRLFQLIV